VVLVSNNHGAGEGITGSANSEIDYKGKQLQTVVH
jgi:hypothetical protein